MKRPRIPRLLVLAVVAAAAAILSARLLPSPASPAPLAAPVSEAPSAGHLFTAGAWYEAGFTQPRFPDDRSFHQGGLDERLAALMDSAQRTLDVAIYDIDLETVSEAMARAARRGVRVRAVTDSDTVNNRGHPFIQAALSTFTDSDTVNNRGHPFIQAALSTLRDAGIPIVEDSRRPIMHHKFSVVDGEWVQTGSWNYTDADTYRHNNHSVVIQSRGLAQNYLGEFDKMFGQRMFGSAKPAGIANPSLSITGALVENFFSPQDRGAAQVIRWIGSARQRIHFLAFSFTHDGIGDAMLERAGAGVEVAGVFETKDSDTQFSEYSRLKRAGLDVLLDGNPWLMHHKVIIIDGHVTIFGSFNYSRNADRQNDENLLIVDDVSLAAAFEAEYERVRATALNPPVLR